MIALTRIWRWWTDSWSAPNRARLLYVGFAAAFAALAVAGAVRGDALVAAIAGVLALLIAVLAVAAPTLSRLTNAATRESMETD